jgi:hypothetical protein
MYWLVYLAIFTGLLGALIDVRATTILGVSCALIVAGILQRGHESLNVVQSIVGCVSILTAFQWTYLSAALCLSAIELDE